METNMLRSEPVLPIRRIRKLRRAPETPGGPPAPKDIYILVSYEFGQRMIIYFNLYVKISQIM